MCPGTLSISQRGSRSADFFVQGRDTEAVYSTSSAMARCASKQQSRSAALHPLRYIFILYDLMAREFLTDFELMILLAILRVGDDAYGVPIAREIEATGGRAVLLGAVYAALERLQAMGLVSSSVGDPTPERGGKAKRFFRVTVKGLKAVKGTQRALVAMWTNVPALKGGAA